MKTAKGNAWTRREFTAQSAIAILSGVVITMTGCGDDSNSSTSPTPTPNPTAAPPPAPAPTPPAGAADVNGVVGNNHGHTVAITGAELTAGNALNLDITGSSNHPHTVSVTDAEVGQIASGARVQKTSTNNSGHTHTVTFN